jgi:hypothetical protein
MGCSMATGGYSADYASLGEYAAEMGVNESYLRGVVYGVPLDLPRVGGTIVVSPESRAMLAPIVARIKAATGRPGRPPARVGSRSRA